MVSTKMQETLKNIRRTIKRNWNLYKENRLGLVGLGIIIAFAVVAIGAPVFAPFEPSFRAPDVDTYGAIGYTTSADADIVKIFPTTPPLANVDGASWLVYSKDTMLYLRWVREPKSIGGELYKQTENETENMTMYYKITPFDEDPTVYRVDLSNYGEIRAFDYIAQGQSENGTFVGDRKYNGLIAVAAGNHIVIIDVGKITSSSIEDMIVYSEMLDITPTWVAADVLSRGDTDSAVHRRTVIYDEDNNPVAMVDPWRLLAFGDNRTLYIYAFRYVTSPIEGELQVVKQVDGFRLDSNIITEPLVYFNPYLERTTIPEGGNTPYYHFSFVYVPLENYSLLAVGQQIIVTTNDITLAPPSFYWVEGYKFISLGQPASLDSKPQYVYALGTDENGENGLFIISPIRFSLNISKVIWDKYIIPNAEVVGTPKIIKSYDTFIICFAYNNETGGHMEFVEQKVVGGKIDTNLTTNYSFPAELRDAFFFYQMDYQIFGWSKNGIIYRYIIAKTKEDVGVSGPMLMKDIKTGTVRLVKTDYFLYVGSLDGARYNPTLGLYQLYGLSYDSAEKKVTIFQLKGDRITPLPPGTYPSGNTYWLGTDDQGHDILSQLVWGTRIAFLIGIISAVVSVLIGTFVGLISGYYGGLTDTIIMRIVDILLVLPGLPIILILFEIFSQYNITGLQTIILVLSILGWAGIARVIRAQTLSLKARPFVDAARISGASDGRIIVRHLFPNVLPLTFLYLSFGVTGAILAEAGLSYLGFVRADPDYISWGQILSNTRTGGGGVFIWWWLLPPGLAITLLSLGFYLVGRGFDEIVNPKLRRR